MKILSSLRRNTSGDLRALKAGEAKVIIPAVIGAGLIAFVTAKVIRRKPKVKDNLEGFEDNFEDISESALRPDSANQRMADEAE